MGECGIELHGGSDGAICYVACGGRGCGEMKCSTRISAGKCFTGRQIVIKNAKVPVGSATTTAPAATAIFIIYYKV